MSHNKRIIKLYEYNFKYMIKYIENVLSSYDWEKNNILIYHTLFIISMMKVMLILIS